MTNPSTASRNLPLVLGSMMFGTTIDADTSFALLDRFVERGGTWIDTADCYAFWVNSEGVGGDSERLIGHWLNERPGLRNQVRLSTKIGAEPLWAGSWPAHREGLSARAVRDGFEGCQERLGTDMVDLLWLHQEDRSVPIEETIDAVALLTASGSVRRVGASNHPAWRVERARAHARAIGALPIDAFQLRHSYLTVRPGAPLHTNHDFDLYSAEQRDYAATHRFEVWAYSPVLAGAYDNEARPLSDPYVHEGNDRRLAVLDEVAASLDATRSQVVLAWLVAHGIRPILGGSKLWQLDAAIDAMSLELSEEHLARLDNVT